MVASQHEIPLSVDTRTFIRLLGIGPSTFARWRVEGRLPKPIRYSPRMIRWPRAVVEAYLATGCVTPSTRINGVNGPVEVRGSQCPA